MKGICAIALSITFGCVAWGQVLNPVLLRFAFVSEGGAPLAGVQVQADFFPAPPSQGYHSATKGFTDAQGQFLTTLPDRRPWWVIVGVSGAAFFVDASKPEKLPTVIKCWLGSKPSLVCNVEGDASKVALFLKISSSGFWVRLPNFQENQILLFNLPEGEHQIVLAPAFLLAYWNNALSFQPPMLVAVKEGETTFVKFTVPPTGSILGRITSADNHSIPNASLTLLRNGAGQFTVSTDAQGQFAIEGLPEGEYSLLVTANDFEPLEKVVKVQPNQNTIVNIVLKPQELGFVRGRVVSSDGKAIKEGRIWVERILSPTARQPVSVILWRPEDGRFESKLRPGDYLLAAQSGSRRVSKKIRVIAGQVTDVGELVLPAPAIVEGFVKSIAPLTNTRVRVVVPSGIGEPFQSQWGSTLLEVPVNPDGKFQVEVPPEPVAIVLLPFGMNKPMLRYIQAKPGQKLSVQFDLPQTGAIEGQVIRADSGRPIAGALVQLIDENGLSVSQATTNRLGIYRFEPILPGQYSLRCQGQGLAVGFRHNVVVAEGTVVPVDFVLSTGGSIVGQVKSKTKQTSRMYVMLNADTNFMAPVDMNGRFRIDNITPGRHILMLFRLGDQVAAKEVIVNSGETVEVMFELP
ncbi:MAG: carboxypeptidase-like regulatory domain-containing protein [Armatimonadetes bacterium]|nr:carboxypeptidase-like regulatory domain-containing protein [Armatimonadota bacterium]MDW8028262.1 carboxypeptidase regulatory-like domain-containing protein [Armatimonadota bacterium]